MCHRRGCHRRGCQAISDPFLVQMRNLRPGATRQLSKSQICWDHVDLSLFRVCVCVCVCVCVSFVFFGLHLQHMGVPRLGVKSKLQLPAYTTATATWDLSHVCDLHHSSQQCPILNPLSEARNRTRNLLVPSRIPFRCATMGTRRSVFLN